MTACGTHRDLRHLARVCGAILSVLLILIAALDSYSAASASETERTVSSQRLVAGERATTTGLGCVDFGAPPACGRWEAACLTTCNGRALGESKIRHARNCTYDASCTTSLDGISHRLALGSGASKYGQSSMLGGRENERPLGYDPFQLLRETHPGGATKPGVSTAADVESTMGGLPKGKSPGVRTVDSAAELNQTFDSMTAGGTPSQWPGYNGKVVRLPDGTEVGLRNASKSGGETIDVRVPGKPPTKVHIE